MNRFEEKIMSLLQYRDNLDEEEKEVFDMLIDNAWEIAKVC